MPKFVIERDIKELGRMSAKELHSVAEMSCGILMALGTDVQWLESFVTADKMYCIYIAPNERRVREHASLGGFPANRVSEVRRTIDPTTAE